MCPHDMANFDPVMAEIGSGVWGTQQISTAFAFWQRYCTASVKVCSDEQRAPPIFGWEAITLGIGPRSSN